VPNFIYVAASIAELAHGEKSVLNHSHSLTHSTYMMRQEPKRLLRNKLIAAYFVTTGFTNDSRHIKQRNGSWSSSSLAISYLSKSAIHSTIRHVQHIYQTHDTQSWDNNQTCAVCDTYQNYAHSLHTGYNLFQNSKWLFYSSFNVV